MEDNKEYKLKYCVDETADVPVMLINQEIGEYEDEGINGAQFQEELLYLDGLGKEKIEIWINSVGGSVIDGLNIASTILRMKTPICTINIGVACSMAGVIFMMADERIMMNYSLFMMHDASGGDETSMSMIKESLAKMLSAKSNLSAEQISYLMGVTTWLTAEQCMEKGICTQIEDISLIDKKVIEYSNLLNIKEYTNKLISTPSATKKTNNMLKISNKLNLTDDATEDVILSEIEKLQNEVEEANALKEKYDELVRANEAREEEARLAEEARVAEEARLAEEARVAEEAAIVEMINGFAVMGKIKNDAETIEKWVNLAKIDKESVKDVLASNLINKSAEKITNVESVSTPKSFREMLNFKK